LSRNRDRLGLEQETKHADPPIQQTINDTTSDNPFSFVVPTEFVELPSGGIYYPENHPLYKQEAVEIKQMTAREEDILTSRSLLKNGVAIERVIQSLLMNKAIDPNSLLVCDRNAVIIAARISGYGNEYTTGVNCPSCEITQEYTFDLNNAVVEDGGSGDAKDNGDGTFNTTLPRTGLTVTFRLLCGQDEKNLSNRSQRRKSRKANTSDRLITNQLKSIIVSVNSNDTAEAIDYVVNNLPSMDSTHLRRVYKDTAPNIDLTQHFFCSNCDYEQDMEVPLNAEFFWPDI